MKNENSSGNITVSPDVIATIVKNAIADIEGVDKIYGDNEIKALGFIKIKNRNENGNIKVYVKSSKEVDIEIPVVLSYGANVMTVSKEIQEKAKEAVESVAGMDVKDIDIIVEQISLDEEK